MMANSVYEQRFHDAHGREAKSLYTSLTEAFNLRSLIERLTRLKFEEISLMLFDLCCAQLNRSPSMQLAILRPSTLHRVQSEQQFTFDRSMNPGIPVPRHGPGINTIPRVKVHRFGRISC